MPMPNPNPGESKDDFMVRCMGNPTMNDEYPDQEQRAAVCIKQWGEPMKKREKCSADLVKCCDSAGQMLNEIMLTPWGKVDSTNGAFTVDEESAAEIVADFQKKKKDLPIDYEHTTVGGQFATASGAAPAAGWITNIVAKPGEGIFATVKWNERARNMIRDDEYRYLSPVLSVRKDDKKAMAVTSAALTNVPAIFDMQRVAAKEYDAMATNEGADAMQPVADALKAVLKLAGLETKDGMGVTDMVNAVRGYVEAALKKAADTSAADALTAIASKLGASDTKLETLVAKIDPLITDRVPATEHAKLAEEVKALKAAENSRQADILIAKAVQDGKLNPNDAAQMTWARDTAKDVTAFSNWEKAAPKVVQTGVMVTRSTSDGNASERTTIIASARNEYKANRQRLNGCPEWGFVDASLTQANLPRLTAEEKKAITV